MQPPHPIRYLMVHSYKMEKLHVILKSSVFTVHCSSIFTVHCHLISRAHVVQIICTLYPLLYNGILCEIKFY